MGLPARIAVFPRLDRIPCDLEPFGKPLLAYPVFAAEVP